MAEVTAPQIFRSVEEAYAFVKSHEIATNQKYAAAKNKGFAKQDVSSLDPYRIQWEYTQGMKPGSESFYDGIPFIHCGLELRVCQYGPPRKSRAGLAGTKKTVEEGEDECEDTDNQGTDEQVTNQSVIDTSGKNQPKTISGPKKRRTKPSKKLNCRARILLKKIMKFPEYAIKVDKEYPGKSFRTKLAKQLKEEFSAHTKRYILVLVHVLNSHNHVNTPIQLQQTHKKILHVVDKGCTRIPKADMPTIHPKGVPVLKKWASLKGKNMMDLAMQFKSTTELPFLLARPRASQRLEDMEDQALLSLYYDITGETPYNMFSIANKDFTRDNLHLLLHLCIVFANAASDASRHQQTHPSVRVKGTESNFTPIMCLEIDCPVIEPHMHCPFCPQTDSYTDTGLLRQHYTNKHVEKAIEFAGLKILRCYDACEVVGRNLEMKTFIGGHWHCYKCANGLDKRNSASDHYQSHLKNYESSFQIQIAQDVYPSVSGATITHEIDVASYHWESYQSTANLNAVSTTSRAVSSTRPVKRSYADTGLGLLETLEHTEVYVHEDGIGNVTSTYTAQEIPSAESDTYVITVPDSAELIQTKARVRELEIKCKELEKENAVQKFHVELLQKKDADQSKLIEQHKTEKQDLSEQIETLKAEVEKLKTAENKTRPRSKKSFGSSAVVERNRWQCDGLEHVHSYSAVSFDKAKELEDRIKTNEIANQSEIGLKKIGKNRPAVKHNYRTRGAGVNHSTVTLSYDPRSKPCNVLAVGSQSVQREDLSKMNNEADNVKSVTSAAITEGSDPRSKPRTECIERPTSSKEDLKNDQVKSVTSAVTTEDNEPRSKPEFVVGSPSSNEDLSKLNNDVKSVTSTVTAEDTEICSETSSGQPTAMEEVYNQLSSMRKDIERLKQAALAGNSSPVDNT